MQMNYSWIDSPLVIDVIGDDLWSLLMRDFIKALGISDQERDVAAALAATQELIDFRMEACTSTDRYHIRAEEPSYA